MGFLAFLFCSTVLWIWVPGDSIRARIMAAACNLAFKVLWSIATLAFVIVFVSEFGRSDAVTFLSLYAIFCYLLLTISGFFWVKRSGKT